MDLSDFSNLDGLRGLVDSLPSEIRIINWPSNNASIVIAILATLVSALAAIAGSIVGARLTAKHTVELAEKENERRHRAECRQNFNQLVYSTMTAINTVHHIMRHIDDEVGSLPIYSVFEEGWREIRPMAWRPEQPERLPPECAALLIDFNEVDALNTFQNIILGAASLQGNIDKLAGLMESFTEAADGISGKHMRFGNRPSRQILLDPNKHPKAFRLAATAKSLCQAIFMLLPKYHEDAEAAREALRSVSLRNWKRWGFEGPFAGLSIVDLR